MDSNPERNIMKAILATFFAGLVLASLPAHAGPAIINLSVGGEISPGVYGQVQFGNAPPPPVLYAQPMIIVRQPPNVVVRASLFACTPRSREALGQTLPRVQRL